MNVTKTLIMTKIPSLRKCYYHWFFVVIKHKNLKCPKKNDTISNGGWRYKWKYNDYKNTHYYPYYVMNFNSAVLLGFMTQNGCYISIDIIKIYIDFRHSVLLFEWTFISFVYSTLFVNKIVRRKTISEEMQTWRRGEEICKVN